MANTFQLEIVTPERQVYAGPVASLVAPASEGYLGIMANHAPIVTDLTIGVIKITLPDGEEVTLATSGGFLEMSQNLCTVLADTAERPSEIDVQEVERQLVITRERIASGHYTEHDLKVMSETVRRAENRLKVARGG